jgi:DNA helicase II / ATP-dependent DNA helicase PcrA
MQITADFHVHSKFSRATAGDLDLEHIYAAARIKGVQVVGTGDFCHPAWFAEIKAKLESAEPGLLRLKREAVSACERDAPPSCRGPVRFILTTEISNIYKKDGRTRKNHNLVFVPDVDTARRLNRRLEKIGNIQSDGRPILGLDARDLLEIVLEMSPDAFLIPAHIWTPWFSMLGAKSGFDSLLECFGDLSPHVFAVETGLSSDPAMNWRVSALDGLSLVSNSDAHSPANLAREANRFDTELSYFALKKALQTHEGFEGTLEFFPEHGKYHLDGHRDCGVCLVPDETRAKGGLCPACGKPLTIGVLYRVEELADRADGDRPPGSKGYRSMVPLADILAEVLQSGSKSNRVSTAYRSITETLGPELTVLQEIDLGLIDRVSIPLLSEAIRRVRAGKLTISPGYDGVYGKVGIFSAQERSELQGQRPLFARGAPAAGRRSCEAAGDQEKDDSCARAPAGEPAAPPPAPQELNSEQEQALTETATRLLIVAGPGTGKTHTLTRRIRHLIDHNGVPAERILALTFTRRAAEEMQTRLTALLGVGRPLPLVTTIHGFCLGLLREDSEEEFGIVDEQEQQVLMGDAVAIAAQAGVKPAEVRLWVARAKQNLLAADSIRPSEDPSGFTAVYRAYQQVLRTQRLLDYEDLIFNIVSRMETEPDYARACRERFFHVMVDEYQDLNFGQYRLIRNLAPTGWGGNHLCVIGDPDQSIYGFRGSDRGFFDRFEADYPDARVLRLTRNYRSTETILAASYELISRDGMPRERTYSGIEGIRTIGIIELRDEHAEAEAIARRIESLVGGTGYHSIDMGRALRPNADQALSYADFAVLTRTHDQTRVLGEHFGALGIPYQSVSRQQVYQQEGVAAVLAILRIISGRASHTDFVHAAGVLDPALGKKSAAAFRQWCIVGRMSLADGLAGASRFPVPGLGRQRQLRLIELVRRLDALRVANDGHTTREVLARIGAEPGIAALFAGEESQAAMARLGALADTPGHDRDPRTFLDQAALQRDTDLYHPHAERVALISMHAAKGLEFPVVFVAGCEDGLIPLRASADREEERRLLYVAMTRARQRLYLTRARRRRVFGKAEEREMSPFVKDIEARWIADESPGRAAAKRAADQMTLF